MTEAKLAVPTKPGRAAFIFIFFTVALDMLALGVVIPVLPKLVLAFEAGDVSRAATIVGIFSFAFALMQVLFQPMLGAASDHFGRRPVVLLSNLGLGLDYVLMALAPNLWWLFVGRLIAGFTAASFSTASAYIADITAPEMRAARYGMMGAAFGLGFTLGPALGGVLGAYDLRAPFWAAAILSFVNFAYGFFVVPESLPPEKRTKAFVWRTANFGGAISLLKRSPTTLWLAGAAFLSFLAHASLASTFVLYVDYRYQWDAAMVGWTLAFVGITSAIVSGAIVRPAVKKFGEWPVLFAGLLFGAGSFALYAFAPTTAFLLAGVPLGALWGLAEPAMQSILSRETSASEQGRMQGALGSLRGVAGMLGPLLFAQTFSASVAAGWFPGVAYLLASLLLLAGFFAARLGRVRPLE